MSKIVVIYSGGMDSRTVLEWALHNYNNVGPVNKGPKHFHPSG